MRKIGDRFMCVHDYVYGGETRCFKDEVYTITGIINDDIDVKIFLDKIYLFMWEFEMRSYFKPVPFKYGK